MLHFFLHSSQMVKNSHHNDCDSIVFTILLRIFSSIALKVSYYCTLENEEGKIFNIEKKIDFY